MVNRLQNVMQEGGARQNCKPRHRAWRQAASVRRKQVRSPQSHDQMPPTAHAATDAYAAAGRRRKIRSGLRSSRAHPRPRATVIWTATRAHLGTRAPRAEPWRRCSLPALTSLQAWAPHATGSRYARSCCRRLLALHGSASITDRRGLGAENAAEDARRRELPRAL